MPTVAELSFILGRPDLDSNLCISGMHAWAYEQGVLGPRDLEKDLEGGACSVGRTTEGLTLRIGSKWNFSTPDRVDFTGPGSCIVSLLFKEY